MRWLAVCSFGADRKILSIDGPIETKAVAVTHLNRSSPTATDIEVFGPVAKGELSLEIDPAERPEEVVEDIEDPVPYLLRALKLQLENGRKLLALYGDPAQADQQFERWTGLVAEVLVRLPTGIVLSAEWGRLSRPRLRSLGGFRIGTEGASTFLRATQTRIEWLQHLLAEHCRQPAEKAGRGEPELMPTTSEKLRSVFVVHGRKTDSRDAMFEFLAALCLRPLEWEAAVGLTGKSTPYIGEVLDAAFGHAQAVLVLLTADDIGRLDPALCGPHEEADDVNLTPQARLNVIFEAGMALGRCPDRTILVELERTRRFSDMTGRHTLRFKGTSEDRNALKNRLRSAGCTVDDSGDHWLRAGRF